MGKIYKTVICKMLDVRKGRIVISERQETTKVSPMIALAYSLERVFSWM